MVAHSQGTEDFFRALDFLDPQTKSMIQFYGNGGQRFVPNNIGLKGAVNFITSNDPVPAISNNTMGRRLSANFTFKTFTVFDIGPGGNPNLPFDRRAHDWDPNYQRLYFQRFIAPGMPLPNAPVLPPGTKPVTYPQFTLPGW